MSSSLTHSICLSSTSTCISAITTFRSSDSLTVMKNTKKASKVSSILSVKKERFPIELIAARTQKGLTQADLADAVGVSERSVSLWERGKVIPRIGIRMTLAHFLLGKEQQEAFLFDDERPEGGELQPSKPGEEEAEQLKAYLQRALTDAPVSDVLKKSVSEVLENLPELLSK